MSSRGLLIVTTSYPDSGDGSEAAGSFVADVAVDLAQRIPVRVVAPGRVASVGRDEGGVLVHRFASSGRPLSLLSPKRLTDWPAIAGVLRSLRAQTLAAADAGDIAHTLALWALPSGWAAASLQRARGVPYSVWVLGSDIWSLGRLPLVRGVLARVIRGARHRFADGLALADDAASISGEPFEFLASTRQRTRLAPSPLASAPPYRLLFLGRWHPNKGIDLLLAALERLPEAAWSQIASLRIAGGGPLETQVHAGVKRLRTAGRPIVIDGFLTQVDAEAAVAACDWVLIPSRIESIPIVFSDAVNAGRAVLATPVGDLPALVAGRSPCGVLCAAASADAIADGISRALSAPPTRFAEGIAAAGVKFDLAEVTARLQSLTCENP